MAAALEGMRIAWIGVGRMGEPMSRRLMDAGAELVLCDREPARLRDLLRMGAKAAPIPATAAQGADVVVSMVPDDAALLEVAAGPDGVAGVVAPGQVYVDMSTVSPAASARVAAAMAPTGAAYLRSPVSGSTATAAAGQLSFFCSGPAAAFERCGPLLDALGTRRRHVGEAEEARVLKLLINLIVGVTPAVLGEAIAFGERLGLPRELVVDALGGSVVGSPLLAYKADAIKARDWAPAASVDLLAKDLDLALEVARQANVPLPLTALVRQVSAAFQAGGEGGLDFFRLTTWPERLIGDRRAGDA